MFLGLLGAWLPLQLSSSSISTGWVFERNTNGAESSGRRSGAGVNEWPVRLKSDSMAFRSENELQALTVFAWIVALPAIGFVVYLLWRKFGPRRRHRRRHSRMSRYLRE